jgi:hypothetical protein
LIKSELEAMLEEEELRDQDFVFAQKNLHRETDANAEVYWTDVDDPADDELIINEPDLVSTILDSIYALPEVTLGKKILTKAEVKKALKQVDFRKQ